jgi:hypothetical protein
VRTVLGWRGFFSGLGHLGLQGLRECRIEQHLERLGELCGLDVVIDDADLLEERLVELTTQGSWCVPIRQLRSRGRCL